MTTHPEKYIDIGYNPSDFIWNNTKYDCSGGNSDAAIQNCIKHENDTNAILSKNIINIKNTQSGMSEKLNDSDIKYNILYLTRLNMFVGIIGIGAGIYYILQKP